MITHQRLFSLFGVHSPNDGVVPPPMAAAGSGAARPRGGLAIIPTAHMLDRHSRALLGEDADRGLIRG